jgi:endoglucanase
VHHRAASGQSLGYMSDTTGPNRHTMYGALAGGPNASDGWVDDRNDYQRNEVAIDYNAGFTAALGRLAKEYGGTPVANSTLVDPVHDAEMTVEPTVYDSGVYGATIALAITNKSGWPPRIMNKAKARYYFTLDGATTISQIKVAAQNTSGCAVTGPVQYSGSTYYAEINCAGVAIYPGDSQAYQRTTGLKIDAVSPGTWDATNDWSAKSAKNITLYDDNGTLVFGTPPNGTGPSASPSGSAGPSPSASGTPSPSRSTGVSPSRSTGASPSRSAGTSPSGGTAAACSVSYVLNNPWSGGAGVDVTVTNKSSAAVAGWTLRWTFPGNQQLAGSWNATVSQSGAVVTASNPASSWNGTLAANGGSATFGFNITFSGSNPIPTDFTLNDAVCS